jgi:hypothetical protein
LDNKQRERESKMNIYLLERKDAGVHWGEYDSCVILAKNEEEARHTRPDGEMWEEGYNDYDWCRPDNVSVRYLGKFDGNLAEGHSAKDRVICSSYNS